MPVNERALIGQEVAGYYIEDIIGKGGMAVVYLAVDSRLDRRVALKILHPVLSTDDRFRQRFVLESRTVAGIDHPNIIPIYEANAEGDVLYIAMRYVDGLDLRRHFLDRGPLAISQVNRIFAQVAAALDTAHAHDLIHRDVKPANILITGGAGGEHVYLTDFGITKNRMSISGLTQTEQFIGTPRYMAPEQINKEHIDGRCDQYALACVVYEALSGRLPFQRDNDIALLWAHLAETPAPLSQLRPDLPMEIDGVMAKALAKSPDQRYATCTEFIADLRDVISGQGSRGYAVERAVDAGPPSYPGFGAPPREALATPARPAPQAADERDTQTIRTRRTAATQATREAKRPKSRRPDAKGVLLGAAGSVAAIVAIILAIMLTLQGGAQEWKEYPGSAAAPMRFEHPGTWTARTHTDLFAIASPQVEVFESLFVTPVNADWADTNRLIKSEPESATGVYAQILPTITVDARAEELQDALASTLPGQVSILSEPVQVRVAERPAVRVRGTLSDRQNEGRLEFTGYVVERDAGTAIVIYYCVPDHCDTEVSERIASSIRFPAA